MLKLKRLQILGFKSFCDRTDLKFHGEGVAAIIGPNGCGKSNIADAISWVLGEQSAKTLRGSRMEDVIFAGTRDRKPTGMAEVSLTLIDPEEYSGADAQAPTEIDIQDELPEESARVTDDWDEAEVRAWAAEETERAIDEAQPGKTEEVEVPRSKITMISVAFPDDEPVFAFSNGALASVTPIDSASVAAPQQVVLKIRRRKFNQQQFHAGEIVVTRRLFRSGDSEYLLNGKLCRLRDIQELFMGTGLGPETYALIEQGRIGQILSSRPTDRRAILEEAAGITKFKTKKRLAEARLEDAKLNLSRVNDIFDEVTRQMNSLKRQASKAERYAKLRDEMQAQLRIVLASKFAANEKERQELDAQLNSLAAEMQQRTEAVQQLESEHGESTERGYAIESELRENRECLSQIEIEIDRARARRRHNEERCAELVARAAVAEAELAQAQQRLGSLEAERDSNRQVLESAAADLASAQQELELAQKEGTGAAAALAEVERQQEEFRIAIFDNVGAAARLRNQLAQAEERLAGADREGRRLQTEIASTQAQVEAFGGQRGQLALEFETVTQRAAGITEEIAQLRRLIEAKRREEAEGKNRLDLLRAEFATALGRKGSLEAVIAEHGYSNESVRRLFQSGVMQSGRAPVGVLADFLEVEPQFEHVVEDFLRDELNYVVVKSWDAADEGLRLLRSDVDGRATFLVHPEDAQAKFSFILNEAAHSAPAASVVPLKHTIRVLDGFGKSLEVILPKLRDGYIVPSSDVARSLALENPNAFFLAHSGECFHNVTVTGGKQRAEGPLSMKRELREVLRQLEELERALREQEMKVLTLGRELKDLTSLLERLEAEKREAEHQSMTSRHLLQQLDSEMARVSERVDILQSELQRLAAERAEQESIIAARQTEAAQLDEVRASLETKMAAAQESLAALRQRREEAAQNSSQRAARVAALEERHRSAAAVLARIDSMFAEMNERVHALTSQIEASAAEKVQREAENLQLEQQAADFEAERNAGQARESLLQSEKDQVRARLAEIDEMLRNARQLLDQARDRRGELQAAAAKLEADGMYMANTCLNELGIEREALLADTSLTPVTGDELAACDQSYREMRSKLDAMGPVNMLALEEYRESAERHDFLDGQRNDLIASIENTTATIREIDEVSREKFQEAFTKINENFQTTFKKLFGGGHALMKLTDEENSAESGIDVVASPPGKRLQNVLLLSGGEKALTALALLVGIFQYTPSPFCILDEVDAPLDEANIGRFTELVREMSIKTQFVLITHSKKTMSIAPVLYGVTMQEPGVSKLVSVKFGAA